MSLFSILKIPSLIFLKLQLKLAGVECGSRLRGNDVVLLNVGNIRIGNDVYLRSYPAGEPYRTALHTHCPDAKIIIGDNCILNGTRIHCRSSVIIENYCLFGPGVRLIDNDSHRLSADIIERRTAPDSAPIIIRKNAWLGLNVLVLKGVEIGQNSIVAANSVVTKSVPENTLVAGNPAKFIKKIE